MTLSDAPFICPICGSALTQLDRRLACANAHSFDIAREGYVNLLRQHNKARVQGDAKEMLHARRAFLQRGHYAPIAHAIAHVVGQRVDELLEVDPQSAPQWIADMGCGEGYYVQQLMQQTAAKGPNGLRYCGFDLSKEAVRMAARLNKAGAFAVADLRQQIPLASRSMQLLLNIFAPRNAAEFARVLVPGGWLLTIIPHENHLQAWRTALAAQGLSVLGIEEEKALRLQEHFDADFKAEDMQHLCYNIDLAQDDLENLLQMTPTAWHLAPADLEKAGQLAPMQTAVSVQLFTFRRR